MLTYIRREPVKTQSQDKTYKTENSAEETALLNVGGKYGY